MKNLCENLSILAIKTCCLAICFLFASRTFAQPSLYQPTPTNCFTTITTSITPPSATEKSVGLFYRIDSRSTNIVPDSHGSYFWDTIVTGSSASKTMNLPNGDYDVVCYERRKGGPIKTGHKSISVNNTGPCSNAGIPQVYLGGAIVNNIYLNSSWNIFDNTYFSNPNTDQFVTPAGVSSVNSPTYPWIFVTLTVTDWGGAPQPNVKVFFNKDFLVYDGAIADNYDDQDASSWKYFDPVLSSVGSNYVTINRKAGGNPVPPNRERHIHLIFKVKEEQAILATIGARDTLTFTAIGTSVTSIASTSPMVKGGPYDPNSLRVDKKTLCPCMASEWLVYTVNFQNIGNRPAKHVAVELLNYANHLKTATNEVAVMLNPGYKKHTFRYDAPVTYAAGKKEFFVSNINLPGTKQLRTPEFEDWETSDQFKFAIRKKDCLKYGTIIQPKVKITFYENDTDTLESIETNLEITDVTGNIPEGGCPQNPPSICAGCVMRKGGWFARLFKN